MDRAKIKSKTTYHNYLRDLNDWGYLKYYPSFNPARGSKIRMAIFFAQESQKLANTVPKHSQNMVPYKKHKTKENFNKLAKPQNKLEVLDFFKKNNWPEIEGRKFYAYYETKNWKLSKGLNIQNWKEIAKKYVEKGFIIKEKYTSPFSGYVDNLKNNNVKDYDIPL